ncbi:AAA family ATPase [Lacipirellula limnantheis]|uniref:DNA primase/polymerase bifunctional N-terminal domain-containing protein n=1 Tax=Lacipirellula limnantheis TaxID=2528024 RepID=A0A517U0A8_9BACT|nr:AAA family ATPase [Lacipirellula limnantheis]QDT74041.1 hypothetical protein I41_32350 [Lacipirellula limnantheis]
MIATPQANADATPHTNFVDLPEFQSYSGSGNEPEILEAVRFFYGDRPAREYAESYQLAGLSVIPIKGDGTKSPACLQWRQHQAAPPTAEDVARYWFADANDAIGIALIHGKVSGNSEVVDLDNGDLLQPFVDEVNRVAPGLFDRLTVIRTPRPGYHLAYKCPTIGGSQKLARRAGGKALIETKGEGGYTLAPGSPAACHPTGGLYLHIGGPQLTELATITPEERQILFGVARSFDEVDPPASEPSGAAEAPQISVDDVRGAILALPESVAGEKGHDKAYRAACEILRWGVDGEAGRALLDDYNAARCSPAWSKAELDHKWKEANKEVLRGREFGIVAERAKAGGKAFTLDAVDFVDFMAEELIQEYLVDKMVAEQQHLLIGGPKKVLKTCIGLDLGMSIASGSPFLGHFDVLKTAKVLIVSAESGRKTIQATCNRIRDARSIDVARGAFRLSFKRPQLAVASHLETIRREIEEHGIGFAVIDPAYLCCRPAKGESSNVFDMGDVLYGFGAIGEQTGCTMAIMHHSTKGANRTGAKLLDLDGLSGSGFAEWGRQFMLLNRLAPMTRRGVHRLSLNVGGSARHHGQYELTIDEGDERDPIIGARWGVDVQEWSDDADENAKAEATTAQMESDAEAVKLFLRLRQNEPATEWGIYKAHRADPVKLTQPRVAAAIRHLLAAGELEPCQYAQKGQSTLRDGGFRLADWGASNG